MEDVELQVPQGETRRMNITIHRGISDEDALWFILQVVKDGRISNFGTTYCFLTAWNSGSERVYATADRTKAGNDSFQIWKTKEGNDGTRTE